MRDELHKFERVNNTGLKAESRCEFYCIIF